jgi:hypothetical protein
MMGDGESINRVINLGSMDDVGTRIEHLTALYDLWLDGIDILDRWEKHNPRYAEKRKELEIASRLLMFHIQKDYQDKEDRAVVDSLPLHGDDIK